jgi:hypothetical protein
MFTDISEIKNKNFKLCLQLNQENIQRVPYVSSLVRKLFIRTH